MLKSNADIDLWNAFKSGDKNAFGEIFRRHYPLLLQYGNKICTNENVVEDCIQELFTELWQNKPSSQIQSVKAYLLVAVKYKIFKTYRNHPSIKSFEESQDDTPFEISHDNFLVATEEDHQRAQLIITALKQLPGRQKEIIYLKIYQNLRYEEISEVMGINYQVARNLFSQAVKSLRKLLVK